MNINNDALSHVLSACYVRSRDDGFLALAVGNKRLADACSNPGNVVRFFRSRYGNINLLLGLLWHPRFLRNKDVIRLVTSSLETSQLPLCRVIVEEVLDRFSTRADAADFLMVLVRRARCWYPDLAFVNVFPVLMQLRTVCDGVSPDIETLRSILHSSNTPPHLIYTGDIDFGYDVRKAAVFLSEDLCFDDVADALDILFQTGDASVTQAVMLLYERTTGSQRASAQKKLGRLARSTWDGNVLCSVWQVFPHVRMVMQSAAFPSARTTFFHKLTLLPDTQTLVKALRTDIVEVEDFSAPWFCRHDGCLDRVLDHWLTRKVDVLVSLTAFGKRWSGRDITKILGFLMKENFGHLHPLLVAMESKALPWRVPLPFLCRMLNTVYVHQAWDPTTWTCVVGDARRLLRLAIPPYARKARAGCAANLETSVFGDLPEARMIKVAL